MSRFINKPTLYRDYIAPRKMSFDTVGGGLSGGRNGLGESISINISGGPQVIGSYIECNALEPEQHEYLNMIAARMNDGIRFMNVPIDTSFMGPFPALGPLVGGIPHSDSSLFSDGSGYSQATVWGNFAQDAELNAGQIVVNIVGAARDLRWSDWMSVNHPNKGWRAFRYWERSSPSNVSITVGGTTYAAKRYTLGISPPLREEAAAGTRIELAVPRCVMKFPDDFTLPYEPEETFIWRPTLRFVEAW